MAVIRASAERIGDRAARLARIGAAGTAVTRLGLTAEERRAHDLVARWLAALGARVRHDEAGNLLGRFGGDGAAVLIGSHLDSVPEGGSYDGALGVVVAVEAIEALVAAKAALRRPVEVVGWADEEGVRFGIGLYGSSAAFGRLPANVERRADARGVTIREALRALGLRGDPRRARIRRGAVRAYIEPHIEQGPRLARRRSALAVVSTVVGIAHARVTVRGRQDHAGTTPMAERRDALVAAAELVAAVEAAASARPETVGTVGEISVRPGAKNVVPGECVFSIDLRAPRERDIDATLRALRAGARGVDRRRGTTTTVDLVNRVPVTRLDADMRALLRRACGAAGVDAPDLVSGAGHDAVNPQLDGVPTGMIFMRSHGGSHSPRESADPRDAARAATALAEAVRELCA
ncbi:MAG: Zn-dependent hydrolase [Chloroflexota bacterium]|nr:Zn-dependent hydrolase [Chloroflexota bacterium]